MAQKDVNYQEGKSFFQIVAIRLSAYLSTVSVKTYILDFHALKDKFQE